MKYSEFREYLRGTNFEVNEDSVKIQVKINDIMFVKISKAAYREIILPFSVELPEEFELIRKSLELAETPLDERGETKRYYIKHRFIRDFTPKNYINITTEGVILGDRHEGRFSTTKFTKAEIEAFKKRFDTDFNDFELIEVED